MKNPIERENMSLRKAIDTMRIMAENQRTMLSLAYTSEQRSHETQHLLTQREDSTGLIERLKKEIGKKKFDQIAKEMNMEFKEDLKYFEEDIDGSL